MIILDANILVYAYNADAPQHAAAAAWVEELFGSDETIGLPWMTLWAFLRIVTNPRLWPNPRPVMEAFQIVREWLAHPGVFIIDPQERHIGLLERLVTEHRAAGPMLSDAALAALALEHGAVLVSTDQDFSRFRNLRWRNPLGR